MFKSNKGISTVLGISIVIILVIILAGTIMIWKYRFGESGEEVINSLGGQEISFSENCDELSKQLETLIVQVNYCDNDPECLFIEHDICSLGPYILVNRGADLTALYKGMGESRTRCPVCDWLPEEKQTAKCLNHICVIDTPISEVDCNQMAESFSSALPSFFENIEQAVDWCNECVGNSGMPYLNPFTGPFCNPKTADAGKICTDFSQCEGNCLGKTKDSKSGLCSDVKTIIGCVFQMENGKATEACYD